MRLLSCVVCCALSAPFAGADDKWVTIKGRVVFPDGKPIPKRAALNVNADGQHCLKDGPILDESILVNEKTRGVKNVVVYLRPLDTAAKAFEKAQIHPDDAKRKPAEVVITQPCCMFVDRVTVARPGDTLVVKNPAPVPHNFFWASTNNGDHNQTVPKQDQWKFPAPLKAESGAIQYKCTIHGWMTGYVRIFDHPYYAVTDADGNFEIKNAPAGKFRIVYWHETGVRGGSANRFGEVIEIKGPTLEMKPTEFEVGAKPKP
jgi:signal peptidase I